MLFGIDIHLDNDLDDFIFFSVSLSNKAKLINNLKLIIALRETKKNGIL